MSKRMQAELLDFTYDASCNDYLYTPDVSVFHSGPDETLQSQAVMTFEERLQAEYKRGLQAGLTQSKDMFDKTVGAMEASLQELAKSLSQIKEDIEASHWRVIKNCLSKILPNAADKQLVSEITGLILQAAKGQLAEPLCVTLHPDNKDVMAFLEKADAVSFKVEHSNEMSDRAIKFSWPKGHVDIDVHATVQACLDLFEPPISNMNPYIQDRQNEQ